MDVVPDPSVVLLKPTAPRRVAQTLVLGVCSLLLLRLFTVEPYEVPTGSMAPAIAGRHRTVLCPRCGATVLVGRHPADDGADHWYAHASCPNCGCTGLDVDNSPEVPGDQILVNKNIYLLRRPRRWEAIVFRRFGKTFIKRVIGLPGESVEILDGDVYVNGQLARKTLAEARALYIPFFDNDFQPRPGGWRDRWEAPAGQAGPHPLVGTELRLDGTGHPDDYQYVTYRHYLLDEHKCQPICDEYAYNGGEQRVFVPVHDFLLDCDLEVGEGTGCVALSLTDGQDTLIAEIPVGPGPRNLVLRAPLLTETASRGLDQPTGAPAAVYAVARTEPLHAGKTYHVEMAFVDRRLTLAIDGTCPLEPMDLPPAVGRPGVVRPVTLGVRGVRALVRGLRLCRDVHYTQAGRNGVRGQVVHLPAGQYFVLGDNSPSSDDSRFWPDGGAVPADSLVGKPFLVHLPTRVATWEVLGRRWQSPVPDWARVRWLR
jgi:signal peptidase I